MASRSDRFDHHADDARRGVLALVTLCAIPVVLWARALPLGARFADGPTTLRSTAAALGVAGVSSFALNLVLGARLAPLERFFGGLDRLYRVHRINGRIAFLLLLAHGLLMIAGQVAVAGIDGLGFVVSSWTVTLGAAALVAMAVSIGLTLYGHLGHELFVYVQRTFGLIFMIAALHVFRTPGTKSFSPALTYYLLAITALGLGAFVYRSVLGELLVPRRDYRVTELNALDPSVLEVRMEPASEPLHFTPGQFIFVSFYSEALKRHFRPFSIFSEGQFGVLAVRPGAASPQYHPFSITAAPKEGRLSIVVKAVGDFTRAMRVLEHGARARIEGPYGTFSHLNVGNRKQVWIAGGIGLTPFLSMARSLEPSEREIDFFYCMEDGHQGYFLDELYEIADRIPRFRVIPIRRDRLGFVSAEDIAGVSANLPEKDVLLCGPPPMVDALSSQLVAAGVPPDRIHFEQFGFV